MSTQIRKNRKYELKARAESQERTRQKIAEAAAELHEEVGPAETTVAEIARRAGVSRLTVYKHFPDNSALYPACSAHYLSLHPLPDFERALAPEDSVERVRSLLRAVYGGLYREQRAMIGNLQRDRSLDPALDEFMRGSSDAPLDSLADAAAGGFQLRADQATRVRALIRVALDFGTWDRLTGQGLADDAAAELMTEAIASVASPSATAR
jgi:AcrR family transcriptional regulator